MSHFEHILETVDEVDGMLSEKVLQKSEALVPEQRAIIAEQITALLDLRLELSNE